MSLFFAYEQPYANIRFYNVMQNCILRLAMEVSFEYMKTKKTSFL